MLLWFATDEINRRKTGIEEENFSGSLDSLERLLDNHLKTT
jgi:hypothetical protein